jgi:autotransporter translocation and assembly factor TamB
VKLRFDGSADDPRLDVAVQAFNLGVRKPAKASGAARSAELGQGRLHVTYSDRSARAEIDFASAHGGTLVVDATTSVDLSYPRVKRRLNPAKLPVRGKVVAKDLEVGWIAAFNPGVESLGGEVSADVKLGGTVGEPQFIGDVRWKNGELVATMPAPKKAAPPSRAAPPQNGLRPSPR